MGEPFADDFDYLHRTLLDGPLTWFDGCGSVLYWRPLSRQAYFGALGPIMLAHPRWIAGLHVLLLGLTVLLLYRAFRRSWSGPASAVAASFPILVESTRMLVAWPSHFQDLGALMFTALAIHERAHQRLATTLVAVLAALLCKEVPVIAVLLLPWWPGVPDPLRVRLRWAAALAAVAGAWGIGYWAVVHRVGMTVPTAHTSTEVSFVPGWPAQYLWGFTRAFWDSFNVSQATSPWKGVCVAALATLGAVTVGWWLVSRRTRKGKTAPRSTGSVAPRTWAWVAWGLVWFAALPATITRLYPDWMPHRSVYAALGLGVATTASMSEAPVLLAALVVVRLVGFVASPGADRDVGRLPTERGAVFDVAKLARLQRLTRETRELLETGHPRLVHGSVVMLYHLPAMSEYAYAGNKSLQVWYRDSTLQWVSFDDAWHQPKPVVAVVEGERDGPVSVALVQPPAMHRFSDALQFLEAGAFQEALTALREAETLQTRDSVPGGGRAARVFLGSVIGRQAVCQWGLGDMDEAMREAHRAESIWIDSDGPAFVMALANAHEGRFDQAERILVERLRRMPADTVAYRLLERVRRSKSQGG